MDRWKPPVELTKKEQLIMKRLNRVRTLFGFLRLNRHKLFDDAFQEQLEGMYRQTGAGDEPHAPAMLCMVLLLQGYVGASDAEAVELAVMDRRWQMVLDCLDVDDPPFSQGALQGVPRADGGARDGPRAARAHRGDGARGSDHEGGGTVAVEGRAGGDGQPPFGRGRAG